MQIFNSQFAFAACIRVFTQMLILALRTIETVIWLRVHKDRILYTAFESGAINILGEYKRPKRTLRRRQAHTHTHKVGKKASIHWKHTSKWQRAKILLDDFQLAECNEEEVRAHVRAHNSFKPE